MMGNNGYKKYTILIEYDGVTNQPTGRVKPNLITDPDYVPPVYDPIYCPVYTTTTTTIGNTSIAVSIKTGVTTTIHAVKEAWGDYTTTVNGTWIIPNLTYDYVLFDISALTGTLTLTVTYSGGMTKSVSGVASAWKVMLPGTFNNITAITIS